MIGDKENSRSRDKRPQHSACSDEILQAEVAIVEAALKLV